MASRHNDPLRQARADLLFGRIGDKGLPLTRVTYDEMNECGLTKSQVERAANDLVAADRIQLTVEYRKVVLHVVTTEGGKK